MTLTHDELHRADRYLNLKERFGQAVERMHHGMAQSADLDGLEKLLRAFEGVALRGERVSVTSAQAQAAAGRRRGGPLQRTRGERPKPPPRPKP